MLHVATMMYTDLGNLVLCEFWNMHVNLYQICIIECFCTLVMNSVHINCLAFFNSRAMHVLPLYKSKIASNQELIKTKQRDSIQLEFVAHNTPTNNTLEQ